MTLEPYEREDEENGRRLTHLLLSCSCSVALVKSMSMEIWRVTGKSFSEMQMKVVMVDY